MHEHPTPRARRRVVTALAATLSVAATLTACGNGNSDDSSPDVSASSTNTGKPGATKALRSACVETNDEVVDANTTWNKAVDSRSAADLTKATQSMNDLATTLREQGKSSGNATFKAKAEKVATNVTSLTKAKTPSKTVDTTTYNDAVDDLTAYCAQMFPASTKKAA